MDSSISLVFSGNHSQYDILDAIDFKGEHWKKGRELLSSLFSDFPERDAEIFLNSYMTSKYDASSPNYNQKNLLRELGIRATTLDKNAQDPLKQALSKTGFFSDVPLHILTFDIPKSTVGKIFIRAPLRLLRSSLEGVMHQSQQEDIDRKFVVLDSKSHSIAYLQESFPELEGRDLASSSVFSAEHNFLFLPQDLLSQLRDTLKSALPSKQFTVIRTPSISSFSNDSQQSLS